MIKNKAKNVSTPFNLWLYGTVFTSTLGILCLILKPWRHPLSIPYGYSGDAYFDLLFFKNVIESGTLGLNNRLGFPGQFNLFDYPNTEFIHWAVVSLISFFSQNPFLNMNIFFWLTFVGSALAASWSLKKIGFSDWTTVLGSLIFAFLPYHLVRGVHHLFLGSYFIVPFVLLVSWWLQTKKDFAVSKKNWVWLFFLSVSTGSTGIYYAYFSSWLLGFSGVVGSFQTKSWRPFLVSVGLVATIFTTLVLNLSPNLLYWAEFGRNQEVGKRLPYEALNNGLQLHRLVIPLKTYGLPELESFLNNENYNHQFGFEQKQYLGLTAIVGLLLGLSVFLVPNIPKEFSAKTQPWAKLLLFSLFLSVSSGLGTLIAFALSPQIRAYNRIQPFIGFICIVLFLHGVEWALSRLKQKTHRVAWTILVLAFAGISLYDQVSWYRPLFASSQTEFRDDQTFFNEVEALLPNESAVFQLPYQPFPESPPAGKIIDYELLKGYLHTNKLKWSYATMKGRPTDLIIKKAAAQKTPEMISSAQELGFSALLVDRHGYPDGGKELEASISAQLGKPLITSSNYRFNLYQLPIAEEASNELR